MCETVSLLYSRDWYDIVNQLYWIYFKKRKNVTKVLYELS